VDHTFYDVLMMYCGHVITYYELAHLESDYELAPPKLINIASLIKPYSCIFHDWTNFKPSY